jgi:hypothetical protein
MRREQIVLWRAGNRLLSVRHNTICSWGLKHAYRDLLIETPKKKYLKNEAFIKTYAPQHYIFM